MTESVHVGFVGLGKMGWPMARNLVAAGFALSVRDADPDVQERFAAEHGCAAAHTPEAFAGCPVVVTMLPDDRIVQDAMLRWEGGVGRALRSGAVVVDMSSSNPEGTKLLGARLAERGVRLVDAPVSGGVTRAADGTLTLMVGGDDEEAIGRVWPLLEVLGERLFRTGPLGSGHAMKALNNVVGGTTYAIVVEALAVGQRYGLDPATMIDVMNASSGRSFNTEHVVKDHVLTGTYATGFALGLLSKDVGIAADLADAAGVDAPLCRLSSGRWSAALAGLGPAADHSEAHKGWWPADLSAGAAEGPRRGRDRSAGSEGRGRESG
jgi:3-hydroxyisobutyrate dehydrogenase